MTKIGEKLLWFFLALGFALNAWGKVSIQAAMEPQNVGVGDDFVFTVAILSTEIVEIGKPRPPDLAGFELLDIWDVSSVAPKMVQTPQGMDWQEQRKKVFNYRLRAKKPGRMSIGAFEITIDGKAFHTQPLAFTVLNAGQARNVPRRGSEDDESGLPPGFPSSASLDDFDRAEEELYNRLLQRRGSLPHQQPPSQAPNRPDPQFRSLPQNPKEAFFIQVEVDKTEVYEGEQVTASWYVYTRGQMETLERVKFPDLKGFWKEIIEEVPTIQFTEEIINGVVYRKALLASHALFPLKAGTAAIDEYKIKSRVREPLQGFGGMGFGRSYQYTKSSQRVSIKVKPLPLEGRPSSFTGAVGSFDLHSTVDSDTVPMGQPFNLHLRLEGSGNAKGVELPAINWPPTLELYDTKSDSKFFKNGKSYKQFELLVIPRKEGEIEVPAIEFSFFDPSRGQYETRKTEPLRMKVNPGANGASSLPAKAGEISTNPTPTAPAAKPAALGDVLPSPILAYQSRSLAVPAGASAAFWFVLYLGVFGVLAAKARKELFTSQRKKDLTEIFQRRWKIFEKGRKSGDHRRLGADMVNLYYLVLGGVAGEQGASQEVAKILEKIPPSLRREFGAEISRRIEIFQTLAFAPEEALGELKSPARLDQEIEESRKMLATLVQRLSEVNE